MKPNDILGFFIAFSFLFFGLSCLFAPRMKKEFERYGIPSRRRLTGGLQLLGSIGLVMGQLYNSLLAMFALAGLGLLMVLGVIVRLRIRDPWPALMPALFYAILCTYLLFTIQTTG